MISQPALPAERARRPVTMAWDGGPFARPKRALSDHGGWPSHVMKDIKNSCKGASFVHELAVQFDSTGGDRLETSKEEIRAWTRAAEEEL